MTPEEERDAVSAWWGSGVSRIEPDLIELRGYPVQELVERVGFVDTIWLLVTGELPTAAQSRLLQAALVASVDHGPQAPSIAVARMTASCGGGINSAVASAVNTLDDVHGGAGQQCLALLGELLDTAREENASLEESARRVRERHREQRHYVPGFGHRFHRRDPRRDALVGLVEEEVRAGRVPGDHLRAALALERVLGEGRAREVPMNIDGVTAIVYGELGCEPELARGLFVLSRSVGILAHAWEERSTGSRIKGPVPRFVRPHYTGPSTRRTPGT